jgi:hypothetical protein
MIKRITRVIYGAGMDDYIDLPTHNSVQETEQELWTSFADLTGADYAYDQIGIGQPARKNAIERVAFTIVEDDSDDVNDLYEDLETLILGRVQLLRSDGSATETAYARLLSMPSRNLNVTHNRHMPVVLIFARISDWEAEAP